MTFAEPPADLDKTASGLQYKDINIGDGAVAKAGDHVYVHYTGWLTDGTQFDSSVSRGKPIDFILGTGGVIKGWDEGIAGMKVGGRRLLVIPPGLGYGAQANGSIPANSTLIFEVVLVGDTAQ
jgi:FKBP-type peptidyl-prolyl cis-trans isomerase FkpA